MTFNYVVRGNNTGKRVTGLIKDVQSTDEALLIVMGDILGRSDQLQGSTYFHITIATPMVYKTFRYTWDITAF